MNVNAAMDINLDLMKRRVQVTYLVFPTVSSSFNPIQTVLRDVRKLREGVKGTRSTKLDTTVVVGRCLS